MWTIPKKGLSIIDGKYSPVETSDHITFAGKLNTSMSEESCRNLSLGQPLKIGDGVLFGFNMLLCV